MYVVVLGLEREFPVQAQDDYGSWRVINQIWREWQRRVRSPARAAEHADSDKGLVHCKDSLKIKIRVGKQRFQLEMVSTEVKFLCVNIEESWPNVNCTHQRNSFRL